MNYDTLTDREWRLWLRRDAKRNGGMHRQSMRLGVGYSTLRYILGRKGSITSKVRLRLAAARTRIEAEAGGAKP